MHVHLPDLWMAQPFAYMQKIGVVVSPSGKGIFCSLNCLFFAGNHSFFHVVDDIVDLYLKPMNSAENATRIFNTRRWYPSILWYLDKAVSEPVPLEAGKEYLLEAHMAEFSGGDFFCMGIR